MLMFIHVAHVCFYWQNPYNYHIQFQNSNPTKNCLKFSPQAEMIFWNPGSLLSCGITKPQCVDILSHVTPGLKAFPHQNCILDKVPMYESLDVGLINVRCGCTGSGIILRMPPASKRQHYNVKSSLIGNICTKNDPCYFGHYNEWNIMHWVVALYVGLFCLKYTVCLKYIACLPASIWYNILLSITLSLCIHQLIGAGHDGCKFPGENVCISNISCVFGWSENKLKRMYVGDQRHFIFHQFQSWIVLKQTHTCCLLCMIIEII